MDPKIPDFIEPLVGYKLLSLWRDPASDDLLRVVSMNFRFWYNSPMQADCRAPRVYTSIEQTVDPCEDPPSDIPTDGENAPEGHMGNGCGFYAYNTTGPVNVAEEPDWQSGSDAWFDVPVRRVPVRVFMWGKTFIYEHGYRSEWSQIDKIFLPAVDSVLREEILEACENWGFETDEGPESREVYW